MIIANPIPLTGSFVITLSTGITMGSTLSMTCVTNCVAVTPVYNPIAGTVTMSSMFGSYVPAGSTIDFKVTGFINPSAAGSYPIKVTSYETVSGATPYGIDTISGLTVVIKALNILKATPTFGFKFIHWYTI